MGVTPVSPVGGPGVNPSSAPIYQPAGQQLATGLQASGVREPAATLDIAKEAWAAAAAAARAREAETIVQPAVEPNRSQLPAGGRRKNPFLGRRRRRRRQEKEPPSPPPTSTDPETHLDVTI